MKRVFLVHGWEGFPENHWFPWLKRKLEEMNFQVIVPQMPDPESKKVAQPWLKTPLDWKKVRLHGDNFTAIFSDDDPFVPIEDAQIFKENLKAKIVITRRKAHFTRKRSIADIPEVLDIFKTNTQHKLTT